MPFDTEKKKILVDNWNFLASKYLLFVSIMYVLEVVKISF